MFANKKVCITKKYVGWEETIRDKEDNENWNIAKTLCQASEIQIK